MGNLGFYVQMATTMLISVLIGRHHFERRIAELMPWVRKLQWRLLGDLAGVRTRVRIIFQVERVPGPSPLKVLGGISYVLSRLSLMLFTC